LLVAGMKQKGMPTHPVISQPASQPASRPEVVIVARASVHDPRNLMSRQRSMHDKTSSSEQQPIQEPEIRQGRARAASAPKRETHNSG